MAAPLLALASAPPAPAALRADGRLAAEPRAAVSPDGACEGARFALALVGALRLAARAGLPTARLGEFADGFVRRALDGSHAAAVVEGFGARARAVVAPLAHPRAERPGLIDLAAMLEQPAVA
ncbi:hypothetical protein [Roseisolibacter sp. H3M3-2]|uniref:hypothetical protein n=1 Tax=Roseisolibacter sp. H3M3-2 TaxID=3031323 RepID=UPI0023DA51E6|nr:hypothetical protein [Roseisolibacter sp. H3M3-2]MDF1506245.1 hypothetical protein [Roseisolibacter sp. H3M3-2]